MSVATNSVLQKQQNRLPTSMRFERVQEILSNDPALSAHLGPRNQPIPSRYGEHLMFSKEVVDVTNAIHAEGKDAHKISKNDVLKAASRILMKFTANGNGNVTLAPSAPVTPPPAPVEAPVAPAPAAVAEKKTQQPKSKPAVPVKAAEVKATKATPQKKSTPAKAEAPKPVTKPKATPAKAAKVTKEAGPKKPEQPAKSAAAPQRSTPKASEEPDPAGELPESELPPEKQPLHLPAAYDPKKYPHYDVQSTAYSMLLSALTLVTHYERYPGFETRQKKLEDVLKDYLGTCNQITIG
jgi:hypothetical protein